ncbi:MAG: acyl-CoA carboxylase subunit beta [Thermodesulfobacteriota bacterium]|nr:acyl-CoA carboxylase subunit beta [Thermodesulfobacteriota bacterium]
MAVNPIMEKLIKDLEERKARIELAGGADKIEKQHQAGKLSARERILKLLDQKSFVETDMFVHHRCEFFGMNKVEAPDDGVVTGYGSIDGRQVFIFSQDFTVLGGSLGEAHASKIVKIMDLAAKVGAPLIGINDSGGGRIQEGIDAQFGYSRIFFRNSIYSGVIPQLSAILGPCAGGAVYSPAITDFIFMTEGISRMFLTGPNVIKETTGEVISDEELGGARVHNSISGVAHFYSHTEEESFLQIRRLLTFLPNSNRENPPVNYSGDPLDRPNDKLLEIVPVEGKRPYNVIKVIEEIVDDHNFFEVHQHWAKNMVVGFARIHGHPIGVIANQPLVLAGTMDINASDKAARFIRFCDCFNIPLLTLVDTPAFLPGKAQELGGIIRHGAKILFAYSEATVPKVTVVLRKGYGGGYVAMCHRELGADAVFAWPTAEIAMMGAEGAANIIFRREIEKALDPEKKRLEKIQEYREQFSNPYVSGRRGYVDYIISPAETRAMIVRAFDMLWNKQEERPKKKHGSIPL